MSTPYVCIVPTCYPCNSFRVAQSDVRDTSRSPGSPGRYLGPSWNPPGGPQTRQREPLSGPPPHRCKICRTFRRVPFGCLPTLFIASRVPTQTLSKRYANIPKWFQSFEIIWGFDGTHRDGLNTANVKIPITRSLEP